jgi:lipoprotein LpqH
VQIRIGAAAALLAVAATAGCGLTGTEPSEPSQQSGRITIGDKTQQTKSVKCTQVDWSMTINASAETGSARALLRLGGEKPIVSTVNIENIDGLSGVAGGDLGKAEASVTGSSVYTVSGTAVVSESAHPGQTKDLPFTIEAPC